MSRRINIAKSSKSLKECIERDPESINYWLSSSGTKLFQLYKNVEKGVNMDPSLRGKNELIIGKAGCGKTTAVKFLYPNAYVWDGDEIYWPGYDPEIHDVIVIDEMDSNKMNTMGTNGGGINKFKNMSGGMAFRYRDIYVPAKYSPPKKMVITSNHSIEQWVKVNNKDKGTEHMDLLAIQSRFKIYNIHEYCEEKGIRFNKNKNSYEYI